MRRSGLDRTISHMWEGGRGVERAMGMRELCMGGMRRQLKTVANHRRTRCVDDSAGDKWDRHGHEAGNAVALLHSTFKVSHDASGFVAFELQRSTGYDVMLQF